ncbi:hypothetical protein A6R68_03181, partial [Neotoma lepida]
MLATIPGAPGGRINRVESIIKDFPLDMATRIGHHLPSNDNCSVDRIINLVVGSLTTLLILVTLISAFVFPQLPPKPLNIFFAVCISLSSITACILIYWYRQGDLEPKFRNLIYYILFSIIMLCICANLYFHDVGSNYTDYYVDIPALISEQITEPENCIMGYLQIALDSSVDAPPSSLVFDKSLPSYA